MRRSHWSKYDVIGLCEAGIALWWKKSPRKGSMNVFGSGSISETHLNPWVMSENNAAAARGFIIETFFFEHKQMIGFAEHSAHAKT